MSLESDGYTIVSGFLEHDVTSFLYKVAFQSETNGELEADPRLGGNTRAIYGHPIMQRVLALALPQVEAATGRQLLQTYSFFRIYRQGSFLHRHKDRAACEFSVTINLGGDAGDGWPIWVSSNNQEIPVHLAPGDAMIYRGCDVEHWREHLTTDHQVQVFLHYVDKDGPQASHAYDQIELG